MFQESDERSLDLGAINITSTVKGHHCHLEVIQIRNDLNFRKGGTENQIGEVYCNFPRSIYIYIIYTYMIYPLVILANIAMINGLEVLVLGFVTT